MLSMLPISIFMKPRECFIYSKAMIEMSHKGKESLCYENPNRAREDIFSKAWWSKRHLTDVRKCPLYLWKPALNTCYLVKWHCFPQKEAFFLWSKFFFIQLKTDFHPQKEIVVVYSLCEHILQIYQPVSAESCQSWGLSVVFTKCRF